MRFLSSALSAAFIIFFSATFSNQALASEQDIGVITGKAYGAAYALHYFYKITNCKHPEQEKALYESQSIIVNLLPKKLGDEFLVIVNPSRSTDVFTELENKIKKMLEGRRNINDSQCRLLEKRLLDSFMDNARRLAVVVKLHNNEYVLSSTGREDLIRLSIPVCMDKLKETTGSELFTAHQLRKYCECGVTNASYAMSSEDLSYLISRDKLSPGIESLMLKNSVGCMEAAIQ